MNLLEIFIDLLSHHPNMRSTRILKAASPSTIVQIGKNKLDLGKNDTVFSMIQPTGVFHLGNYLGAVKSWVDIADQAPPETEIIYGIADLHATTIPKVPADLRRWRHQALASIIASGVDPDRCHVYYQSALPQHAQLHWLLSTITGMGYLSRMVQWKSKMNMDESQSIDKMNSEMLSKLQLGLFSYPTLQAADILLHKATLVPVGDDQSQHLELTRYIAGSFNHKFAPEEPLFPIPSTLLAPFKKILSLRDHTKKMSKSDPDQNGCLYITDSPETIQKKIRKSLTDSLQEPITYDPTNRPAIANLILMTAGLTEMSPEAFMDRYFPEATSDHKHFKNTLSEIIIEKLKPIRTTYEDLMKNQDYLQDFANKSALEAQPSAQKTIDEVYKAMGYD